MRHAAGHVQQLRLKLSLADGSDLTGTQFGEAWSILGAALATSGSSLTALELESSYCFHMVLGAWTGALDRLQSIRGILPRHHPCVVWHAASDGPSTPALERP
jgi:hypothetical protein